MSHGAKVLLFFILLLIIVTVAIAITYWRLHHPLGSR